MKNPSLLLPLLAALASPSAAAEIPRRCDIEWIKQALPVAQQGGTPADPKKYLGSEAIPNGSRPVLDLNGASFPCEPAAKHFLQVMVSTATPGTDPVMAQAWRNGLAEQLKVVGALDTIYAALDAMGTAALSKADAAADAAVKAGVAVKKDGADASKLRAAGLTGSAFAALKGYALDAAGNPPQTSPADMKAGLSALLQDAPAVKNAPKKVLNGPAVHEFRAAVIALAQGANKKKPGAKAPTYEEALKSLTDPTIAAADDDAPRPAIQLSGFDYGLRNLLASRAAAVDAAVAAARKRLNGASVQEALAAVDRGAGPAPAGPKAKGPDAALQADVLNHLQGIQDYKDLNALYDKNKTNADWVKGPEGVAVAAQLDAMRKDAASASVAGGNLTYTVGGQKLTDGGIRVAAVKTDAEYRGFIADAIAQNIASNPFDAKVSAALAAFRGQGAPGTPITTVPPKDQTIAPPVVETPPQQTKTPPPPPAKPKTTWAQVSDAAPWCVFCGGRGDAERFLSEKRADDAAAASDAQRRRDALQRAADQVKKRAFDACQAEATRLNNEAYSPDYKPETVAAMKKDKIDKLNCSGKADTAFRDFVSKSPIATDEQLTAAKKAKFDELDAQIDGAYTDGVTVAASVLKAVYKNARSDRRRAVEDATGYKGSFYDPARVDAYFADYWAGDKLPASVATCKTALGFKMGSLDGKGFQDPSVDNVDGSCGVRSDNAAKPKSVRQDLILHMNSYKGSK